MKIMLMVMGVFALVLLQACGGQPTKAEVETKDNGKSPVNTTLHHEKLTVPETQIIRELYQAGCLIEQVEINRRKQNMRISCAKDLQTINSSI